MQSDPDAEHPRPSSGPPQRARRTVPRRPDEAPRPTRRRGLIPAGLLDEQAVFVVRRLQREGHEAYLVGGCVRDLLAGLEPKDFDVATDAYPNRIKRLFRSARVIGRRFRLVHVRFPGDHVIETATFRGDPSRHEEADEDDASGGRGPRDWRDSAENVFGTAPEDAQRRDFTINALFYDPVSDEVIDYVGGLADMEQGIIRSIGAPAERLLEDPVRMLRAVHFAQRMEFALEPGLEAAIRKQAGALDGASQARLYVELIKMLTRGRGRGTFQALHALGVLRVWLPELCAFLDEPIDWPARAGGTHAEASQGEPLDVPPSHAAWNLLGSADRWGLAAHGAPDSLALAMLFAPWLMTCWRRSGRQGLAALDDLMEEVFRPVALRMSIPRRASTELRDVLAMLDDMRAPPPGKRRSRMLHRSSFPIALAFLEIDLMSRDADPSPLETWRALAQDAGIDLALDRPQPPARRARRGQGAARGRARGGRRRSGRRGGRRATPSPEAGAWIDPPPP